MTLHPFQLTPQYHERVWGGTRFKQDEKKIGEAWIVFEDDVISSGDHVGHTLKQLAASHAVDLLGAPTPDRAGSRFPLLIKLLDPADWLSLQVHPNDEQAKRLEGKNYFGKTEAWHILESDANAQLIAGLKANTSDESLKQAIRGGTILDHAQYVDAHRGDTIFIRAGTIHALGPGLFLYEIQQTSDLTYRVFDWNRPQTNGRALHIEKSLAVADASARGQASPQPQVNDGEVKSLVRCEYFALDLIGGESKSISLNTRGESFHALTIREGAARVEGDGWAQTLQRLETLIIPASCGAYAIHPQGNFFALKASVE